MFTAVAAVVHALTFPGLFAPTGLLNAGPQTTAWLYQIWHIGFPLLVLGYALLKGSDGGPKDTGIDWPGDPGQRRCGRRRDVVRSLDRHRQT